MLGLRQFLQFTLLLTAFAACEEAPEPAPLQPPSWGGTDFSQLPKVEAEGWIFRDSDSNEVDPILFLADQGLKVIRLKVWNNASGDGSLAELTPYAQRIHDAGMQVMLTFHYSNTWADPGAQTIPTQWANLSDSDLLDSVRLFTKKVIQATNAEYVQIGNEINHGMMKPFGTRDGSGNFQRLLQAGLEGARAADDSVMTFIHYAGFENADIFYRTIDSLDFDAIGLSYYPKWHGKNLGDLRSSCFNLSSEFERPVYLVESSYPFTLGWADWTNNHIGSADQIMGAFPPSRAGQKAFLDELRNLTDSLGTGMMYWGGELVAYKGPQAQDGSPYENQALFSFNGVALPAISALGSND
jgi:arabinogalactan endo-1,4-beta-galactosidase